MNVFIRNLLAKDSRSEEDWGIKPQTRNKGVLLAYRSIQKPGEYNLSNNLFFSAESTHVITPDSTKSLLSFSSEAAQSSSTTPYQNASSG